MVQQPLTSAGVDAALNPLDMVDENHDQRPLAGLQLIDRNVDEEQQISGKVRLHAAGLRVPQDVSVAGFDGIEFADYCEPPLTTVRQPREEMGRAAAELLFRLLAGAEIPAAERTIRLPVSLRPAHSTAAPP